MNKKMLGIQKNAVKTKQGIALHIPRVGRENNFTRRD
jgi:hypothetical protein